MASRSAAGGYVVTSGEYTEEAKKFTQGLNITLIDGRMLREMIDAVSMATSAQEAARTAPATSACPKCGTKMKKWVIRQGDNVGKEFWGCAAYPKCNGTRPMEIPISNGKTPLSAMLAQTPEKRTCPDCGGELVFRQFQSGQKSGQHFYGCVPCKKGWPV